MTSSFQLRPYRVSDEDAAIALWQRTWQLAYPSIDFAARVAWWRQRWRNELVPAAQIIVAEQHDTLQGFVTIDATGYLDQIVVAPEQWGSPLAAALLDEAKRLSPASVTLLVNKDNARAIRFYERNGFAHAGEDVNPTSGRPVLRMEWKRDPSSKTCAGINIRDATPEDATAACEVLRRSIAELCIADHHNDAAILAMWLANKTPEIVTSWIVRHDNSVLVAVEEDRILAVGSVTDAGEIQLNYVSPDARFRGISRSLLRALEQRAVARGNKQSNLVSTETARRFYLSAGYIEAGPPEGRFGTTSSYPMVKQLG